MVLNGARRTAGEQYTSDERLYLDKDGKVVGEDDPGRVTLLVGKGGSIPMERAREVGLVGGETEGARESGATAAGAAERLDDSEAAEPKQGSTKTAKKGK